MAIFSAMSLGLHQQWYKRLCLESRSDSTHRPRASCSLTHSSTSTTSHFARHKLYYSMKQRRLLLSVAPLPTITETHEDASQPGCSTQSMEEYVDSIKKLAQPAYGPVRVVRTLRPRLFSKPLEKHLGSSSPLHCSYRTPRSHVNTLSLDELAHSFSSHRDPVDWLFTQTQLPVPRDELRRTDSAPAALRLL